MAVSVVVLESMASNASSLKGSRVVTALVHSEWRTFCSYIRLLTFLSIERPATSGKQGQDFFSHMEKTFPGFEFHLRRHRTFLKRLSFGKASKELAQGAISKLLYERLCF